MAQPANPAYGATLRVAFVVGVTPGKWAKVWAERMPRTYLELLPSSLLEAESAVRDGSADAALVRLPVDGDGLSSIPLYTELSVVVAPKDHTIEALDSVTLQDLAQEYAIPGDWDAAVDVVATGAGIAIMPQSVARALSRRDVVARPISDGPQTRIALVWRADADNSLVEEFIGIVRGRTANSSRGTQPAPEKKATSARSAKPDRRPSRRR